MARQNNEFIVAWSSLSGSTKENGWRSIPISSAGPIEIHAGRRFPGNEEALLAAFGVTTIPVAEKLPDGQGFSIERADPHGDGKIWLALTRKGSGSPELFTAMACDLAGVLDTASIGSSDEVKLLRVFLGRVRAWQDFMRKGAQTLSPEAEIGLIGELTLLLAVVEAGVPSALALDSWVGPLHGVQDFQLGTGAVEVKATHSSHGFPAKIGSLEQLDDSVLKPLFVAGVRLSQRESGMNLSEFVTSVDAALKGGAEAERVFSNRLLAAGYHQGHADRYSRRFSLEKIRIIEVTDNFPRIVPGTVPDGIRKVMYEIDLDRTPDFEFGLIGALKKLGVN
jgi:hypothetical protein